MIKHKKHLFKLNKQNKQGQVQNPFIQNLTNDIRSIIRMLIREVGGLLSPPQDVGCHADDPGQDEERSGHVKRSVVTARRVVERPGL
jgi:hypothetical protein